MLIKSRKIVSCFSFFSFFFLFFLFFFFFWKTYHVASLLRYTFASCLGEWVFLVKAVVSKLRLSGIDRSLGKGCMHSVHTTLA